MTKKELENIAVGKIYYKQSANDCKSCYKVEVVEILNSREVIVKGTKKSKKGKESKPFITFIETLHTTPSKATGGYKKGRRKS